jgi:hypothetical protein
VTDRPTVRRLVNMNPRLAKNFVNRDTKKTPAPPSPVTKK